MIPNNPRFFLWWLFQRIKLFKGLSALAKILFIFTNFLSLPTFYKYGWFVATWQILAEADKSSIASPTKFVPGKHWTKLTRYTKTVINLSIVCRKSYDKSVIELKSVCQIGKNCLLQNSEILKILKRLRINPGNWRWNPLANYAGRSYEQISCWWNFTALKF